MLFVRAEAGVRAQSDRLEVIVRSAATGGTEVRRLVYTGGGGEEILPLAWPTRMRTPS